MTNTVQPVVKDPDAAHPVPTAWRSTFCDIVRAFADGDYALASGIALVAPVSSTLADHIRAYVGNYGETLVELPDESWRSSIAHWMGTGKYWEVLVDLWTKESAPSDLVLHARVFEAEGGAYRIEIDSVHVP